MSQLAGLHLHFLLATAELAQPGDVGVLITAAEWLDTRYGALARSLLLGPLGLLSLDLFPPTARPFADAASTAVIIAFRVGAQSERVTLRSVREPRAPGDAGWKPAGARREVPVTVLRASRRWSPLARRTRRPPDGWVELGELCRVHRGQATGANRVWVVEGAVDLPRSVLFPAVTRARELFAAGEALETTRALKRVVDLPPALDALAKEDRRRVTAFLARARAQGAHLGFIARNRAAWWSVGLREPAPLLATYMARRPPAFVLNLAGARHLNIAHGIYPRVALSASALARLAAALRGSTAIDQGRSYAGGLCKFEPGDMERLWVPPPERLEAKG